MLTWRKVRNPNGSGYVPGRYVGFYRPPGAPGSVEVATLNRVDFGNMTLGWHWQLHDPHRVLPPELDRVPLRGDAPHKRDAEREVAEYMAVVHEHLSAVNDYLAVLAVPASMVVVEAAVGRAVELTEAWTATDGEEDPASLHDLLVTLTGATGRLGAVAARLAERLSDA